MTIDSLGTGETVVARESFSPSPVLFWLKTTLTVTEKRITGRVPNTFAGVLPLGSREVLFPLKQVSAIAVDTKVAPVRMLIGVVLVIVGLSTFGSSFIGGLLVLLIGAVAFASGLSCALTVVSNAGVKNEVIVTLFEKARLEAFAAQAQRHMIEL